MTYLLRFVSKFAALAWETIPAEFDTHKFPSAVAVELLGKPNQSTSFWRVTDTDGPEVNRVIAASYSAQRAPEFKEMFLRFALEDDIRSLGLDMKNTDGDVADDMVKKWHVDIKLRNLGEIAQLANKMKINRNVKQNEVIGYFVAAARANNFPRESINDSLVKVLWKNKRIELI